MDQFYEKAGSLFVEAYDAFYSTPGPQIAGDVAFYDRVAREIGGDILELACGTGRIALSLAKAGLHVTGVDRSEAMLTIARRKRAALPASVQEHLTLVNQDMSVLNLHRRFGFVFVPFRSFQHLLAIDLQRKSLEAIRHHLEPTGRLVLHLFDPRLDFLIDANTTLPRLSGTHPETGRRYAGEVEVVEIRSEKAWPRLLRAADYGQCRCWRRMGLSPLRVPEGRARCAGGWPASAGR